MGNLLLGRKSDVIGITHLICAYFNVLMSFHELVMIVEYMNI